MKTMKVGDGKWLTLTARLTDYDTHWRWKDLDCKKDEKFEMSLKVFEKE